MKKPIATQNIKRWGRKTLALSIVMLMIAGLIPMVAMGAPITAINMDGLLETPAAGNTAQTEIESLAVGDCTIDFEVTGWTGVADEDGFVFALSDIPVVTIVATLTPDSDEDFDGLVAANISNTGGTVGPVVLSDSDMVATFTVTFAKLTTTIKRLDVVFDGLTMKAGGLPSAGTIKIGDEVVANTAITWKDVATDAALAAPVEAGSIPVATVTATPVTTGSYSGLDSENFLNVETAINFVSASVNSKTCWSNFVVDRVFVDAVGATVVIRVLFKDVANIAISEFDVGSAPYVGKLLADSDFDDIEHTFWGGPDPAALKTEKVSFTIYEWNTEEEEWKSGDEPKAIVLAEAGAGFEFDTAKFKLGTAGGINADGVEKITIIEVDKEFINFFIEYETLGVTTINSISLTGDNSIKPVLGEEYATGGDVEIKGINFSLRWLNVYDGDGVFASGDTPLVEVTATVANSGYKFFEYFAAGNISVEGDATVTVISVSDTEIVFLAQFPPFGADRPDFNWFDVEIPLPIAGRAVSATAPNSVTWGSAKEEAISFSNIIWEGNSDAAWAVGDKPVATITATAEGRFRLLAAAFPVGVTENIYVEGAGTVMITEVTWASNPLYVYDITFRVEFPEISYMVSGKVTDINLHAVANAGVALYDLDWNQLGFTYTNVTGDYVFYNVPEGVYVVSAGAWGYIGNSVEIEVEDEDVADVNLVLAPATSVTFNVKNASGAAVGALITITDEWGYSYEAFTDGFGNFESFFVPGDTWSYSVSADGYVTRTGTFTVGSAAQTISIVLDATGSGGGGGGGSGGGGGGGKGTPAAPADVKNPTTFVEGLYKTILERDALPGEVDMHMPGLEALGATAVIRSFMFGVEAEKYLGMTEEAFVIALYEVFLGRTPAAEEIVPWVINVGSFGKEAVFGWFAAAPEFLGVCEAYGVNP